MNDLGRELAPISAEAWKVIEDEAKRTLATYLAGRKLVDFDGPRGWAFSAVATGRARALEGRDGIEVRERVVQPLVELRAPFDLARVEIDAVARGAQDVDLAPLIEAARRLALAEDRLIFDGQGENKGLVAQARKVGGSGGDDIVRALSEALEVLREAGVGGPYALALGPRWYTDLAKVSGPGKYPLREHVRRLIEGPLVWAPGLAGGALVSTRGGDLQLTVGRDVSIGYLAHDATKVRLYFEESVAFRVLSAEAAVALVPA